MIQTGSDAIMALSKQQILVLYGSDAFAMGVRIMEEADITALLRPGMSIGIKPNLVLAREASSGATTTPELVEGIIAYLQSHGHERITIMESSWVGDSTTRAYRVCGYEDIAARRSVTLLDLKRDAARRVEAGGGAVQVCQAPLTVDFLINVPVLKAHCQTALTCALKNLKGCIPDSEKRRFHSAGLHTPIAQLGAALPCPLTVVDGLNGDLTFEEGGTPVTMNRVFIGRDPVQVDAYAAQLLGLSLDEVPYIRLAERFGAGSTALPEGSVVELNRDQAPKHAPVLSRRVESLARAAKADSACSACYGSLIHALHRLEEEGQLRRLKKPVCIGQGFAGKSGDIGVGKCTANFAHSCPGCPPKASDILAFLRDVNL